MHNYFLGRLQGDELHLTEFYIERPGLSTGKHHAVPFHPESVPHDLHYSGSSPLDIHYMGPSLPNSLTSEPTQGRFSVKECQNLHAEASLV